MSYDALVLAGGRSSRMGSDKALVEVDGRTLLRIVLDACAGANRICVAGPPREGVTGVMWAEESPPGGGPVAGIEAGLERLSPPAPLVVVAAVDLPRLTAADVAALVAASGGDGCIARVPGGRTNPLLACYSSAALARALTEIGPADGAPMGRLLDHLDVTERELAAAADADRPADLP